MIADDQNAVADRDRGPTRVACEVPRRAVAHKRVRMVVLVVTDRQMVTVDGHGRAKRVGGPRLRWRSLQRRLEPPGRSRVARDVANVHFHRAEISPSRDANHHGVAAYGDSRARAVSDRERIREDFLDNGDAGLIRGDRFVRVRRENIRRAGVGDAFRHGRAGRADDHFAASFFVHRHVPAEIIFVHRFLQSRRQGPFGRGITGTHAFVYQHVSRAGADEHGVAVSREPHRSFSRELGTVFVGLENRALCPRRVTLFTVSAEDENLACGTRCHGDDIARERDVAPEFLFIAFNVRRRAQDMSQRKSRVLPRARPTRGEHPDDAVERVKKLFADDDGVARNSHVFIRLLVSGYCHVGANDGRRRSLPAIPEIV